MNLQPIKNTTTKVLLALGMLCLVGVLTAAPAQAQRAPGSVGVGGQIGEPSGLTLKVYRPGAMSYDFLAAWESDDFFYVNAHGLFEQHLNNQGNLHFFYGPGGFIGVRDREGDEDDDVVAGVSANVGLGVLFGRFELYGQLTPRLAVTPSTDGDVGGGLGFRFYF